MLLSVTTLLLHKKPRCTTTEHLCHRIFNVITKRSRFYKTRELTGHRFCTRHRRQGRPIGKAGFSVVCSRHNSSSPMWRSRPLAQITFFIHNPIYTAGPILKPCRFRALRKGATAVLQWGIRTHNLWGESLVETSVKPLLYTATLVQEAMMKKTENGVFPCTPVFQCLL